MRLASLFSFVLLLLGGVAAGWIGQSGRRPEPLPGELQLPHGTFRLERQARDELQLSPQRWLEVPWLYADFDLDAQLELGADTTLDIVLRKVEPRLLQDVQRLFHGRFTVLRLSSSAQPGRSSQPWRTREAALFDAGGGVALGPGPVTVQVRGRGRTLTANVAGIVLGPFPAADEHGSTTLLVRSGTAAVRSLLIVPVAADRALPLPLLGGLCALALGLAGLWLRCGRRLWVAGALLPLAAAMGQGLVYGALPQLAAPLVSSEWIVTLLGAPLAAATLLPGRARTIAGLLALALAVLPLRSAVEREAARFPPTPELDAVFGPDAGSALVEALGRRVRGALSVHAFEPGRGYVFLLGGQLLYRRGAAPDEHVETLLQGELKGRLAETVEVVCLPTEDGWSTQQWELFRRCYADYRPRAVVFGVPRDEEAPTIHSTVPRSSPAALAAALAQARAACRELGARLVVLLDDGLPEHLRAVVRPLAQDGVTVLTIDAGASPLQIAQQLGGALATALRQ